MWVRGGVVMKGMDGYVTFSAVEKLVGKGFILDICGNYWFFWPTSTSNVGKSFD